MLDDIDVHHNWLTDVRNLIQNLGLGYVWKNQYVETKSSFFFNCNQLLTDSFIQEMHSFFERSPKCSMYRYLPDSFYLQYYLRKCVPDNFTTILSKSRTSSHELLIEKGRYTNILRIERKCQKCDLN